MDRTKKDNILKRIAKYLLPWKGDRITEVLRKIIFLAAVIALIVILSTFVSDYLERKKDKEQLDDWRNLYNSNHTVSSVNQIVVSEPSSAASESESVPDSSAESESEPNPYHEVPPREVREEFKPLLARNPETIGWLTIRGTNDGVLWIDHPVMQTNDNEKYLYYNSNNEKSKSGALYVDFYEKITPTSQPANIIVFGHNMASGEYFGRLPYYFNYATSQRDHSDISFYKTHPTVEFNTLYSATTYKIFAAMMVNVEEEAGEVFKYHIKRTFADRDDFNEYVAEILDRSTFYNPDVNVQYGDNLLTLSTCMFGNGYGDTELRFVVFARATREGESPEVDVSKAYANPNPKFYDYYDIVNEYKWEGRKWDKSLLVGYEDDKSRQSGQ